MAASEDKDNNGMGARYDSGTEEVKFDVESPARNRYKGTLLSERRRSRFPVLFERASHSWWNPRFDSEVLEEQVAKSSFPQTRIRFQYACFYIIASCAAWSIFFAARAEANWVPFVVGTLSLLLITVLVLIFSYTRYYQRFCLPVSIFMSLLLVALTLAKFQNPQNETNMSDVGSFAGVIEILLMMYTVIPMPLFVCVIIGVLFSILYEVLLKIVTGDDEELDSAALIVGKVLLHFCIHIIGLHIFIMSQVRKRSTFWKVGQSIMAKRDLEIEKQLKEKMINSLMPETIAKEVVQSRVDGNSDFQRIIFRPFTMHQMKSVSILFADIVGFTKMSSNKTAEKLVSLLNNLFGRFDKICFKTGCEKICTLGDCYYCVSGCPTPRPDHAKCCIEMGLGMIKAIKEFDEEHNEEVNMRVGVHTGKVLCGVVGTSRFKFDVMSNDVDLANVMESTGEPGRVHISAETLEYLKDLYEVTEGKEEKDTRKTKLLVEKYDSETSKFQVQMEESDKYIKTYFIVGPKSKPATPNLNTSSEHSGSRSSISEDKHDADSIVVDGLNSPNLSEPRRPSLRTQILDSHNDTQAPNGVTPAFLLGRRQSGFFAISEMSLEEIAEEEKEGMEVDSTMVPINETLTKTRQLRQQTDKQLIHYIQEDTENNSDYFYKPPINQCTLTFKTAGLEKRYREHYLDDDNQQLKVKTFASPRFNAFIDMVISFIFLVAISICCFIVFGITMPWVTYFVVAMVFEVVMLIPYIKDVLIEAPARGCLERIRRCISLWYMRHVLGAVLTSLPAAAVYANFSCAQEEDQQKHAIFYCYLLLVALLHYCNFTMLSSWMKSILASLVGIVLLLLLGIGVCSESQYHNVYNVTSSSFNLTNNETIWQNYTAQIKLDSNVLFSGKHKLRFEIILDMALLLLLVWFLNREFEVSYRLGFHGDEEASADRSRMEIEKKHADWLLHNIIPEHISEQLKKTSKYSKNHKNVGVIFASIVNFHEFYDESYEGGRECLRVLNELVGNFEELLGDSRFKDVEKIKTIGHTLMVASGLNEQTRLQNRHPNAHLYTLLDYTIEMQHVVQQFNEGMLEFGFVLSIGFYCGEVTSGVIGTSKLLYDIWGDTVNIASRMYSTGMPGRIQLPEGTANMLEDKFEFEHRGTVFVKGKGDMRTCFLLHKREGAQWD